MALWPMDPAPNEALGALERLYRRNVITLEEGQSAARLLTGDPHAPFPPPPPPPRAPPVPPAGAPETPASPAPGDSAGNSGGES